MRGRPGTKMAGVRRHGEGRLWAARYGPPCAVITGPSPRALELGVSASHRLAAPEHPLSKGRKFVVDLLIVGVVVAVPVLYAADRMIKVRAQAHRLRTMSERLAAATARADKQQEKRQEAAEFSAALTSVMPAIKRPPLTLPGAPSQGDLSEDELSQGEASREAPSGPAPSRDDPSDTDPAPGHSPHGKPSHASPSDAALSRDDPADTDPALGRSPLSKPSQGTGPHDTTSHNPEPHITGPHSIARPKTGCGRTGPHDHTHPRRPSHSGEHPVRSR
jgi:hypothetical protein